MLFDCELPVEATPFSDLCDDEGDRFFTIDGYACTPLVKAYDLFNEKMRDEALTRSEAWQDGGAVALLGDCMRKRCGYSANDAAKQHLDDARQGAQLCFVYDFVLANAPFSELQFLFDAQRPPLVQEGETFGDLHKTFPRSLAFVQAKARPTSHIDWFSDIYN